MRTSAAHVEASIAPVAAKTRTKDGASHVKALTTPARIEIALSSTGIATW